MSKSIRIFTTLINSSKWICIKLKKIYYLLLGSYYTYWSYYTYCSDFWWIVLFIFITAFIPFLYIIRTLLKRKCIVLLIFITVLLFLLYVLFSKTIHKYLSYNRNLQVCTVLTDIGLATYFCLKRLISFRSYLNSQKCWYGNLPVCTVVKNVASHFLRKKIGMIWK